MPSLVRYGDPVAVQAGNRVVLPSSVDLYDSTGNLVGYATSLERSDTRTVERIRHMSSGDGGRVVEMVPQPEAVTLTVNGFALYNKEDLTGTLPHFSLAARISRGTGPEAGFGGEYLFKSINSQKIPFNIRHEEKHPTTGAITVTWYRGCMLSRYGKTTNVGQATVTETATVEVSAVGDTASEGEDLGGGIIA